jgi:metallo-beta-lactamase family protein
MESTYGDRDHQDAGDVESQLARIVNDTVARGGKVVIPTFALERAQELMYHFARLVQADRIPDITVYLDSPMAVDVTHIFSRFSSYFDQDTQRLLAAGASPMKFAGLKLIRTADESKVINDVHTPCVIMASSGMCTAGRIKHHLRNHIEHENCTVLFVGHQGSGTLGRQILDGAKEVRIHGQKFQVKARIAQIFGFSGHADRSALLKWLTHLKTMPRRVFLTHGEESVALSLANDLRNSLRWPLHVPQYNEAVDLE